MDRQVQPNLQVTEGGSVLELVLPISHKLTSYIEFSFLIWGLNTALYMDVLQTEAQEKQIWVGFQTEAFIVATEE